MKVKLLRKFLIKVVLASVTCALFVSCGLKTNESEVYLYEDSVMVGSGMRLSKAEASNGFEVSAVATENRIFIRTANLDFEVKNFDLTDDAVENFVKSFGGYISDSSSSKDRRHYSVKIPSEKFDEALSSLQGLGSLVSKSIYSEDVTERYYDLETRLESKKVMKEKLESYLSQAKDLKELLEVERQLNEVVADLESMQGSMNRLSNQIEYSNFNINFKLPSNNSSSGFSWGSVGGLFGGLLSNFGVFVGYCGVVLLYVVVFGVPVVAVAAFLYWLLFGKIGLLVKLFRRLRK